MITSSNTMALNNHCATALGPRLGLGLRLGLELEPELRPEFLPPPSRTFGQFSNDPDKPWRQAPPSKE